VGIETGGAGVEAVAGPGAAVGVESAGAGAGSGVGRGEGGGEGVSAGAGDATATLVKIGTDTTFSADTGAGIGVVVAVLATASGVAGGGEAVVDARSAVLGASAPDALGDGSVGAAAIVGAGFGADPVRSSANAGPEVARATASEATPAASRWQPTD
jgi:hypothetical protein